MTSIGSLGGSIVGSVRGTRGRPIVLPSGFTYNPGFALTQGAGRGYVPTFNPRSRIIAPTNTLYVTTSGNNGNSGTSIGQAKRSLHSAIVLAATFVAPTTIHVGRGDYYYADGWAGNVVFASDINLIALGDGPVRFFAEAGGIVWSSAGSGAYSGTLTPAPFGFVDDSIRNIDGTGTWLVARASVADVQSLGGWFWSLGTITVKTADSRSPDANVHEVPASAAGSLGPNINAAARSLYVEGIEHFGYTRFFGQTFLNLTIVDGAVRHCSGNGVYCQVGTSAMFFRTRTQGHYGEGAGADGFTYQALGGDAIESDCLSVDNGYDGAGISNGSTGHGNRIIRCGGRYQRNDGPNIADVVGSLSLNLGVWSSNSRAVTAAQTANYCTDGAAGRMWLAGCYSSGSTAGNALYAIHASSIIAVRETGYDGKVGAGSVASW